MKKLSAMIEAYSMASDIFSWTQFPGECVESVNRRMEHIANKSLPRLRDSHYKGTIFLNSFLNRATKHVGMIVKGVGPLAIATVEHIYSEAACYQFPKTKVSFDMRYGLSEPLVVRGE